MGGFKNHRNGIKKQRYERHVSNAMVNQKLIRNNRRSRKFDPSIKKSVNFTKKIAARKAIKQQVLEKLKAAKVAKALGTNKKGKKDAGKDAKGKAAAPAKGKGKK